MKAALSSLFILTLLPPVAMAHLGLALTVPEHDAVLARSPTLIHFQFMAPMRLTNVQLEFSTGAKQGERVALRLPRDEAGKPSLSGESFDLPLPELPPGSYELYWQAESRNGQQLVDDLSFSIDPPA